MKADFMQQLNRRINSLNLFSRSVIGVIDDECSIAITSIPGADETVYFDGTRDKNFNIQVTAKSKDRQECLESLTSIYKELEGLDDLPSENDSYKFQSIHIKDFPALVLYDEQGFFIYELSITAKITIKKGVNIL
ncbi:phage tail terminator protein [Oceanobacillus neutriphilus]|uniref:Minor capsid protein, phage associated n=1 Tax=Oceanobacillus neutriphilus TaxID=531815 RepID=A0ABQ2NNN3_9BACI|nr:minor capsid protein [Oceanobacillus neutriphilus]GGP07907.1 putative minor capsid protein, phage associated [Oceanobacillus neutriphilus]